MNDFNQPTLSPKIKTNNITLQITFQDDLTSVQIFSQDDPNTIENVILYPLDKNDFNECEHFEILDIEKKYHQTILIDNNEIYIGNEKCEEINKNVGMYLLDNFLQMENIKERIYLKYKGNLYNLLLEEMFALYFHQFLQIIQKDWIIKKVHFIIPYKYKQSNNVLFVKALKILHLNKASILINNVKQKDIQLKKNDVYSVWEIIGKFEQYQRFKKKINRMKMIMKQTDDKSHPELLTMNPNDEYHINKIVEISETLTCKERTKYKLYELDNTNFLFLVSHYFESLDDFINLELSVKKYQGNMKKFVFNPISVTDENIHFFPKISTLYLYNPEDQPIVSIKLSNIVRNELSWFDFCKNSQKKSKKNSKQKIVYMKSDRDIDYEKGKKKNNGNEWYKHDFIISDKVEIIQKKCFFQFTKISSITLPEHIQLQRLCFSNCSFTSITFTNIHKRTELCICGNGIFTTENNVFDCLLFSLQNQIINGRKLNSLTKIILPTEITAIADECFKGCIHLKEIELSSVLSYIGNNTFEDCSSLTGITFPQTVNEIGNECFRGCKSLKQIEIPSLVTNFKTNWFIDCTNLTHLGLSSTIHNLPRSLEYLESLKSMTIPDEWNVSKNKIFIIEDGCLFSIHIPSSIFRVNGIPLETLTAITMISSITKIEDYCFAHDNELCEISGLENIKCFGKGCFFDTPKLSSEKYPIKIQSKREQIQLTDEQVQVLEQWTRKDIGVILFDSNIDCWSINTSILNERIMGKHHLLFLIEEEDGEKFGYYLSTTIIEQFQRFDNYEEMTTDENSFHFNIQSRGRLPQPMIFELLNPDYCGYKLYKKQDPILIEFGDILLYKQEYREQSYYNESRGGFNYLKIKNALCRNRRKKEFPQNNGKVPFLPKRIVVFQMELPLEKRKMKELEQQKLEEYYHTVLAVLLASETTQMKYIEFWTRKKLDSVIFDSHKDNWDVNTSTLLSKIVGKSQLLFIIEEDNGEQFGYYLESKVQIRFEWTEPDKNSFQFNIKSHTRMKEPTKYETRQLTWSGYRLFNNSDEWLIWLGTIRLKKYKWRTHSKIIKNSGCFDYHGFEKPLSSNASDEDGIISINPRRILVIEMK